MGGEELDKFIANHKDNRTLLQKVLDALQSITDKITGAEKKRAEAAWGRTFTKEEWQGFKRAEKKLIQALKAGEKSTAEAMGETRYSVKGKYWRPNLTQSEWALLNRHMEQEIGDSDHTLDEVTQWAYAEENGNRVFAIYGVGDGTEATPLYASGGKTAMADYQALMEYGKEFDYGTDGNRSTLNRWFKDRRRKEGRRNGSVSNAQRRQSTDGHDRVSSVQGESDGRGSTGKGTENRGVNTKFSMKTPVEETRDLLALHNKDEKSILAALELGGLPMPSIAVVKASEGRKLTEAQQEFFMEVKPAFSPHSMEVKYEIMLTCQKKNGIFIIRS